ncbi:MAG: hypothetical protein QXG01_06070 [Candidatus Bathyarchaeia archaeon]
MITNEKPFWLNHPYVILFDLLRLHRIKPWDINIANILNSFLAEIERNGLIDFSISGTALLSSASIHRMKSELVLKMEEPPKKPEPKPQEYVPPPLFLPIRFEYNSASVEDLLKTIEEVLINERLLNLIDERIIKPVNIVKHLDEFLAKIDEHIENFYMLILESSKVNEIISFKKLMRKRSIIEVIRSFIMLLFLANKGKIRIFQDGEFNDIYVQVVEAKGSIV